MKNYQKELDFAKKIALKAGKIILKNFLHSKIAIKSNWSPVTETDFAVSKMVIQEVKKSFPNHEVLDEELQNKKKDAEYLWVCDPVDGTIPFSHNVPTCAFSLALCRNGKPVVGVIYDPFMKRLLYTTENYPSYLNGKVINVKKEKLKIGDNIFGIPYWNEKFNANKYFELLFAKKIRPTYVESIVYQCMLVATGVTKVTVSIPAMPWDRAAAIIIVENAGGLVTNEAGKKVTPFGNYEYMIASNGTVHEEILNIVKQCLKK